MMSDRKKVAIHGFGRIGRQVLKAIEAHHADSLEVAAIGLADLATAQSVAHLLKYDSNYGPYIGNIRVEDQHLIFNESRIPLVSADSPADLPWSELGIDVAIDATGEHVRDGLAAGHLSAGAKRVLLAAPSDDADFTMIFGVNEGDYSPADHRIVSAGSDTTNALAPVARVLEDAFGLKDALMTTVHAYTNEQKLLDSPDIDLRRARSAPTSIVPTSTRADKAIGQVYPDMAGRISGYAVRVPVPAVSILQLTAHLDRPATKDTINQAFSIAADGPFGSVLDYSDEPLVSTDYRGCCYSAVIDSLATVVNGPLVKVSAWYDNEHGYACRVADVAKVLTA